MISSNPAQADRLAASPAELAGDRAGTVLTDLFLPAAHRLDDETRSALLGLIDGLVGAAERALRREIALDDEAGAAPLPADDAQPGIAPMLWRAGLLRDGELIAFLLRCADEQRLADRLRRHRDQLDGPGSSIPDPLSALLGERRRTPVGAAAQRYAQAVARRTGSFATLAIGLDDLPDAPCCRLVWRCAAALAELAADPAGAAPPGNDRIAAAAARRFLDGIERSLAPGDAAVALAAVLDDAERGDDALLAIVHAGHAPLAVALIAARTGIGYQPVADLIGEHDVAALATVLHAGGVARRQATAIAFAVFGGHESEERAERVAKVFERYELTGPGGDTAPIDRLRLDPAYRRASADLAAGLAGAADRVV